jgi:hypothetical protein
MSLKQVMQDLLNDEVIVIDTNENGQPTKEIFINDDGEFTVNELCGFEYDQYTVSNIEASNILQEIFL